MKGLVTVNTHVQYESTIFSGLKVMAKVKVLVLADGPRAMTLAPQTFVPACLKRNQRRWHKYFSRFTLFVTSSSLCSDKIYLSSGPPVQLQSRGQIIFSDVGQSQDSWHGQMIPHRNFWLALFFWQYILQIKTSHIKHLHSWNNKA